MAWTLATEKNEKLEALVDEVIGLIAAAQEKDGYLNTYFTFENADKRWTDLQVMLAGISLDGESYFYQNSLADRGKQSYWRRFH